MLAQLQELQKQAQEAVDENEGLKHEIEELKKAAVKKDIAGVNSKSPLIAGVNLFI